MKQRRQTLFQHYSEQDFFSKFLEKLQLDPSPAVRVQVSRALAKLGREPEAIVECAQSLDQLAMPELLAPNPAEVVHSVKVVLDNNSRAETDSLSAPEFKLL